ncbi:hypothetical protein GCM10023212_11270 [Luteolibacter yonseiensis]
MPKTFEEASHNGSEQSANGKVIGFGLEQLELATMPMSGSWKEQDLFVDDEQKWTGSTCIVGRHGAYLIILTNRHCLGLDALGSADDDGVPEILDYQLHVHFPGEITRRVSQFALIKGGIDLAWLAVEAKGLGKYLELGFPTEKLPALRPGFEVVAVGSPIAIEFRGSHTFGRISAIRPMADELGRGFTFIQTDAAINHGNSGGPLFLKSNGRYFWIGVNTAKVDAADNLGVAISRDAIIAQPHVEWFNADAAGAVRCFNEWK